MAEDWTRASDFAGMERGGWSDPEVAEVYATNFATAADMAAPALVAGIGAGPGRRVLDICCGHGNLSQALAAAGAEVTGLDFSPAMLDIARRRAPGVTLVEGDCAALPFEDASFDAATCGFAIMHVPDAARLLSEARRVLRPGGRFAYSCWAPPAPDRPSAFAWVFGAIEAHGDPALALPSGPGLFDFCDPDIMTRMFAHAGFGVPSLEIVPSQWKADRADTPYDFFRDGTVRGGAILKRQTEEAATAIREEVERRVLSALGPSGPWVIPIPAMAFSAEAI